MMILPSTFGEQVHANIYDASQSCGLQYRNTIEMHRQQLEGFPLRIPATSTKSNSTKKRVDLGNNDQPAGFVRVRMHFDVFKFVGSGKLGQFSNGGRRNMNLIVESKSLLLPSRRGEKDHIGSFKVDHLKVCDAGASRDDSVQPGYIMVNVLNAETAKAKGSGSRRRRRMRPSQGDAM